MNFKINIKIDKTFKRKHTEKGPSLYHELVVFKTIWYRLGIDK